MPTKRADGRWQEQVSVIENGKKKQKYFYAKTKKELLQKIAAEGTAVLMVTHELDTTTYGNRTYVMDRGRLTPSKVTL